MGITDKESSFRITFAVLELEVMMISNFGVAKICVTSAGPCPK